MTPRQFGWALVALSLGIAPRTAMLAAVPEDVKTIYSLRLKALRRSASSSSARGLLRYETEVEAGTKNPAKDGRAVNRYYDVVDFMAFLSWINDGEPIDSRLVVAADFWRQRRASDGTATAVPTPPADVDGAKGQSDLVPAAVVQPATSVALAGDAEDGGSRYDGLVTGLLVMYLMSLADEQKAPPPSLLRGGAKTLNASMLAAKLEQFVGARVDGAVGGATHSTLRRALTRELEKAGQVFRGIDPT